VAGSLAEAQVFCVGNFVRIHVKGVYADFMNGIVIALEL
jgi:hypothetical protein